MMRFIRRFLLIYQGFVVSGMILIFSSVAVIFAVIPGVRVTQDLYENLKRTNKDIEILSGKLRILEGIAEEDIRDNLLMMLSGIPGEKSIPTIISTVEVLGNQTGVSIIDMSLVNPGSLATGAATRQSAAEKKFGASAIPFMLTVSGTYDQIRAFVSKVNTVKRIFDVTSFELNIGSNGQTQARVSLTAFYQPLPEKVGSVQTPVTILTPNQEKILAKVALYPDISHLSIQTLTPSVSGGKRDPFAR